MRSDNKLKYAFPMIITAFLLCIIYVIKGIFPFGTNTIDYYDMAQQIAAFYYHTFDFLHGEKNLFFDPYTALGVNMAMSTSGCSHLSIFNLFFLFVKRENILKSLSIFLMIKMALMSLFMYIYIHSRYKLSYFYEVIFSVGYAFCGYVLMLYMTIQWLDVAALFPLLMLFLHKLIKDGKSNGYIITLTLMIIASYYQSFMILIYIVLMVGVSLISDRLFKKSDKPYYENYHLIKLLISTVLSIILSSFIFLPQIKQTLNSARFNNENGGGLLSLYYSIVSNTKPQYTHRLWAVLLLSFAFAVCVYGIIKYRKDKKRVCVSVLSLFIILSELIVEGVNLFWHFGSYVGYPIRNGYMIYFTVTLVAIGFIQKIKDNDADTLSSFEHSDADFTNADSASKSVEEVQSEKNAIVYNTEEAQSENRVAFDESDNKKNNKASSIEIKNNKKSEIFNIVLSVITAAGLFLIGFVYGGTKGLTLRNVFHITTLVMAITFIVYMYFLISGKGRVSKYASIVMAAEVILFGFIMIGKPSYYSVNTSDVEQEGGYISKSIQLDKAFSLNAIENSDDNNDLMFKRVKNPDTSLNANYGLILRRPVLSNWTHLLSPLLQRDAAKLGYSVQYTRLLDSGGTVFSDALIGVTDVISLVKLDEEIYELKDTCSVHSDGLEETYYLYKCKYTLPFGIITDNIDYDFENASTIDLYNEIYKSITNSDEKIACEYKVADKLKINGRQALYYMSGQTDTDDYNTKVAINANCIYVPSIKEPNNTLYPAHFNNNALYLGTFEDETIKLDIEIGNVDRLGNEITSEADPKIIAIDLDLLSKLCSDYEDMVLKRAFDKSEYKFRADAKDEDSFLLLPISYDKGYKAQINGLNIDVLQVGGMFSAIKLNKGSNDIVIKFIPDGMKTGIIISLFGVIFMILFMVMNSKSGIFDKHYLLLDNLYIIMFVAVIIIMYIVPYLFCVLSLVNIV